jgi:hypothetical protein
VRPPPKPKRKRRVVFPAGAPSLADFEIWAKQHREYIAARFPALARARALSRRSYVREA